MMKCLNIWLLFYGIWIPNNVEAAWFAGITKFSLSGLTDTSVTFRYSTNSLGDNYKARVECRRTYDGDDLKYAEESAQFSGFISVEELATNTQYKCQFEVLDGSTVNGERKVLTIKTKSGVCKYALGMENGAIAIDQIKTFHLWKKSLTRPFTSQMYCDGRGGFLEIDLGRTMTITGLALKSDSIKRYIKMFYKLHPEETYVEVKEKNNNDDLTFGYISIFSRAWLEKRRMTLRYIKFLPRDSSWKLCLQVELYGCAEVCSTPLQESELINPNTGASTTSHQLCYTERVLRFDFGRRVTISGVLISSTAKNAQVDVKFRYGKISQNHKQLSNSLNKTYTAVYKLSDITFWFSDDIITRFIEIELISRICINASFLGCPTDSMNKLGIESGDRGVILTASSSHFNGGETKPNPKYFPEEGTLNSLKGAWVAKTKNVGEWLQACLVKVHIVSGIAIQGQGYGYFQYITSYTLKYGYNANAPIYMYKTDSTKEYTFPGGGGRYVTVVNKFPIPLMARCLRILPKTFYGNKFAARIELLGGGTQTCGPLMKVQTRESIHKTDDATARAFVYAQPGVVIKWSSLNDALVNFTVNKKVTPPGGVVNATYESTLKVSKNFDYAKNLCEFTGPVNVTCYRRFRVEALYPSTLDNHSVQRDIAINISGLIASVDTDHKLTKTNISMLFTCTPKYQSDFVVTYRVAFTNLTSGNTQMFTTTKPVLKFSLRPFTHYRFVLWASNRMLAESLLVNTSFISDEGFASKVKDFVVTVLSKDEIKVQWKHPKIANGIVTNYIIQWRKNDSNSKNINIPQMRNGPTSLVKLFQRLQNYQLYFFRIQPFTNKGKNAGPWTKWISKRTLEGSPSIISGFNVSVQSKDQIVVSWKKPQQLNGVLTCYSVEVKTAGSKVDVHTFRNELERPSFTKVFEKLQNHQRYAFRIRAFTNKDKNAGPWTQWIEKITFEGIPSAVEDFVVTVLSKDEVKVAWKHPKVANGIVTNYIIQWKKDGSNSININIPQKRNGPKSFVKLFQKLENYQLYTFRIQPFTNNGRNSGPWTELISKRTFEGSPSMVTNFDVTVKSKDQIIVSWKKPQQLNGVLTCYSLEVKTAGSKVDVHTFRNELERLSFTKVFEKLQNHQLYAFRIRAFTNKDKNAGPWTEWIQKITFEGIPSAVEDFVVTVLSKDEVKVAWKHPNVANGIVTNYTIQWRKEGSIPKDVNIQQIRNGATSFVKLFQKLQNYQLYLFRIRAFTNKGKNDGPWTKWVDKRTFEGVPGKPRNFSATVKSVNSVSISWRAPQSRNGIIRNYTLKFSGLKSYNKSFQHLEKFVLNDTSKSLDNLFPGSEYTFIIHATTITDGPKAVQNISIPYSAPYAPNLRLEENLLDTKKIIMNTVSSFTGPISHYELSFTENKCSQHHTKTIMLPMQHPNMEVIIVVKGERWLSSHSHMPIFHNISLPLIGNYHVCYRAVINATNKVITGKYSSLILNRTDLARINISSLKIKEEKISFELSPGPLKTKFYQVIVVRDIPTPSSLPLNLPDYKSSQEGQFPYIAAQLDSQDFNAMKNFIVGDGKVYSSSQRERRSLDEGFENGKLKPGTSYSIMQRAVVDQNTFYSSPWLLGVKTRNVAAPSPSTKVTDKVRVDEIKGGGGGGGGGGAIGGTIGATIVIVAVIALAVFFIRRRQQEMVEKKPVAFTNSEEPLVEMGCVNPATEASDYTTVVYDGMDEKEKEEEEVTPLLKNPKTLLCHPKHPSVSKQDFMRRWNELTKDNHLKLVTEYESLNSGQQFSWTESIQSEVKIMNRYANIVAYDHSRVHLGNSPIIKNNYINASFIHGYEAPKVYIASQGPNKASLNSFWQMVWEKEIPVIVMVTNLIERGKSKCEQYWEDKGTKTFGNFEVTLSMTDTLSDHIVRKFTLKQNGEKEKRTVMHFQFVGWPDHGTPEFPLDVVNFRQRVRKMFPYETTNKPVLVHCSAGVGRTGTFICIDAMLQLARSKQKLDVFNYVNYMRAQRIHMIQTEEQYLFVYQALYEWFVCGETECIASEFRRNLDALTSQRTGDGKDGFHDQFKKLRLVTYIPSKDETTEGSRPENIDKNRISSILPSNEKRVLLMDYGGGGSDYVNAVYVNGYKKRDEFIATQYPLSNTLDAFWTMVYQRKIGTIVLLLDSQEDDDLIQLYGKVSEKQTHSQCTISLKNQNHDGIITISKVHVGDNQNNSKNDFDCHLLQMHWHSNGVPSNANDVITMITKMEKHQCKCDSKHILVVCRDGASQCGTLLACTLVLQHLQLEQSVDVLQSVRKVRNSRHQFIPNVEHFQLCYRVVSNYIDSFNTYSNYTE